MREWLGEMLVRHVSERAVGVVTAAGEVIAGEGRGARFGGADAVDLSGRSLSAFYEPGRRGTQPQQHLAEALRLGSLRARGEFVGLDDRRFPGELVLEVLEPGADRVGWLLVDRSEPERAAAAQASLAEAKSSVAMLAAERDELQQILQGLGQALLVVDRDWRVVYVNGHAESLLRQPASTLVGRDLRRRLGEVGTEGLYGAVRRALLERVPAEVEEFHALSGTWYEIQAYPGVAGVAVMFRDVTERRQEAALLRGRTMYDVQTGLPNRTLFTERLTQGIAHARRFGHMLAVLVVDLRGASLEEAVADEQLVRRSVELIEGRLRANDTLGQLGPLSIGLVQDGLSRLDGAARLADGLLAGLSELPELAGHAPSVGIAVLGADGETAEELIAAAAGAVAGAEPGECRYANAPLHEQVSTRRRLENELRHALLADEFRIHYQPEVDTRTGRTVGVEALLRWEHPQRGLLAAGEFLPVAVGTDFILPLGEWALTEVCAQARAWRDAGATDVRLSMNLTDPQLRSDALPSQILALLAEHGLPRDALELEITEAQLLRERGAAEAMCRRLTDAGLRVCVDDFGAGYGPIGALVALAVRKVKIAPALIARLDTVDGVESDNSLDAILQLASVFQLDVVAKGVESDRQLTFLQRHGCHIVQGFCVGRPVPAAQLSAAFRATGRADG